MIALIAGTISFSAEDKKELPKSLAAEAAYLTGKDRQWYSEEVTVSRNKGKAKDKVKLWLLFKADRGMSTGRVTLGGKTVMDDETAFDYFFELVEKEGKRFINIRMIEPLDLGKDPKKAKPVETLEYAIKSDKLTVKGGVVRRVWAGWEVDLAKGVSFQVGSK